ncbi:hypothetical protein B0H13DRAFT_2317734 [Mycena leptocephala]|nr:hypothetical protein B0H13DRAFT_2317734 [Mycena leptocephala]
MYTTARPAPCPAFHPDCSILDHPLFLIYLCQFQEVLLQPCPTARVTSRRPQLSPSVSGRCNPHRCLCSPLAARFLSISHLALRYSASAASLPPLAYPSRALTLAHAPHASSSPGGHAFMRDPFLTACGYPHSRSRASRSVRLPPPAVSITISISHSYFCPLVRTIHPSDPSAR